MFFIAQLCVSVCFFVFFWSSSVPDDWCAPLGSEIVPNQDNECPSVRLRKLYIPLWHLPVVKQEVCIKSQFVFCGCISMLYAAFYGSHEYLLPLVCVKNLATLEFTLLVLSGVCLFLILYFCGNVYIYFFQVQSHPIEIHQHGKRGRKRKIGKISFSDIGLKT